MVRFDRSSSDMSETERGRESNEGADPPERDGVGADGGLSVSAEIEPAGVSSLSTFLEEQRDGPAYQLTYVSDGAEVTRLLHNASVHAVTIERPAAAPAIQCTPLAPGEKQFTVGVADITRLSVVDPPRESYTTPAASPSETATGLRRQAEVHPESVDVAVLVGLLETAGGDRSLLRDVVRALRQVAFDRPEDCTPAIPLLRPRLREDKFVALADALITFRAIGNADAGAIAPATDEIVPHLDAATVTARREAAKCMAAIAEEYPSDAVDAVPGLATIVEEEADGRNHAVYALSRVSREYPDAVKPTVEMLVEAVLDAELADIVRVNATAALGRVVGEYPSMGVGIIDDIAELFDAEIPKLRNNAIALVADVATIHTDVVEPHLAEISAMLDDEDDFSRINASGVVSRVAEDFPAAVEPAAADLQDALTDDVALVRQNACWALGYIGADEAKDALEERVSIDADPDVRHQAAWALAQLKQS